MNMLFIMKKVLVTTVIVCLSVTACTTDMKQNMDQEDVSYTVEDTQNPEELRPAPVYEPVPGDVITYRLDQTAFQEFLNNPSLDILLEQSNNISAFSKSVNSERPIVCNRLTPSPERFEGWSGSFRIGSWPVYTEFIDFMNDPETFPQILSERGIDEEILSIAIITHPTGEPAPPSGQMPPPGSNIPKMCI